MIDLKKCRENPELFRTGAKHKNMDPAMVDALLQVDSQVRKLKQELESIIAQKNKISKAIGPIMGRLKAAQGDERLKLEQELTALKAKPEAYKAEEEKLHRCLQELEPQRDRLWLEIPQPADADVPVGVGAEDNIALHHWAPDDYDPSKTFFENRGFKPRSHIQLGQINNLFDFERGVKIAGSRSYVLTGDGFRLHNAILRYAFDLMVNENGFKPMSVPVLVRNACMEGTGFFPHGKDQAYEIKESHRGGGQDMYLTGTGEVGLMGYHQDEILNEDDLPLKYTTVSTCFRREAGAAGKDTAGLYRVHQFDKVEQVIICKADEAESRQWHQKMIGYVEDLLQRLQIPYRALQCCTGDLGIKNVDMIDLECWMPSRGEEDATGCPSGRYDETHSASRLYDFQTRRLNIRYRDKQAKKNVIAHSLNNTVVASPRILIPILELYQNEDGSIRIPNVLVPYMNGSTQIG